MDHFEHTEANYPETREFMQQFDFGRLEEIFRTYAEKAQYPSDKINVVRPPNIFFATGDVPYRGEYHTDLKGFTFNEEMLRRPGVSLEKRLSNGIYTTVHEEVHAVTHTDHSQREDVGYHKGKSFRLWNEGVTDRWAREVAEEYVRSTAQVVPADYKPDLVRTPEVDLVVLTSKKIAESAGVAERTVWEAIIRGALEGQDFNSPAFRKDYEAVLGSEFFNRLSSASEDEDLLGLAHYLKTYSPPKGIMKLFKK